MEILPLGDVIGGVVDVVLLEEVVSFVEDGLGVVLSGSVVILITLHAKITENHTIFSIL